MFLLLTEEQQGGDDHGGAYGRDRTGALEYAHAVEHQGKADDDGGRDEKADLRVDHESILSFVAILLRPRALIFVPTQRRSCLAGLERAVATTDDFSMAVTKAQGGEGDGPLLWILVLSELAAFGVLLIAFMIMTMLDPDGAASFRSYLHPGLAAANTIILVLSGWQAALAVRLGANGRAVRRPLVLAALLGLAFAAVKAFGRAACAHHRRSRYGLCQGAFHRARFHGASRQPRRAEVCSALLAWPAVLLSLALVRAVTVSLIG